MCFYKYIYIYVHVYFTYGPDLARVHDDMRRICRVQGDLELLKIKRVDWITLRSTEMDRWNKIWCLVLAHAITQLSITVTKAEFANDERTKFLLEGPTEEQEHDGVPDDGIAHVQAR